MIGRALISLLGAIALSGAAHAFELLIPETAQSVHQHQEPLAQYDLPVAAWQSDVLQAETQEGQLTLYVWQLPNSSMTTLQILAPLRDQLTEAGFTLVFECETDTCGGFDFRYNTLIAPEPDMHVNLGDFRFISAALEDEAISLLVSRTRNRGFVQLIHVGPADDSAMATLATKEVDPIETPQPEDNLDFGEVLETRGHTILDGLEFQVGSSALTESSPDSLVALAAYLADNPDRNVTIVGHTDAQGSLSANIALSKRRAQSVVDRLVSEFGISSARLSAEGMGYLAPISSNLTEEGRNLNRRVEVMLLGIE